MQQAINEDISSFRLKYNKIGAIIFGGTIWQNCRFFDWKFWKDRVIFFCE
jgi:hypothetical protein